MKILSGDQQHRDAKKRIKKLKIGEKNMAVVYDTPCFRKLNVIQLGFTSNLNKESMSNF